MRLRMYAIVKNDRLIRFPYGIAELQQENPYTEFGVSPNLVELFPNTESALTNGYEIVKVSDQVKSLLNERTQKAIRNEYPTQDADGNWVWGWAISEKSANEIAAADEAKGAEMRAERNARLAACDWTQLADAPVDSLAWANYRQALRDVPEQAGFPWNVIWPAEPA